MPELGSNDTIKFWDSVAPQYHERVIGKMSIEELKEFEKAEDDFFDEVLRSLVVAQKNICFVELGSGTGRYLIRCMQKILTDPRFDERLDKVIGVDFSIEMIKDSIERLDYLIDNEATEFKINPAKARSKVRDKLILINADVTRPFLHTEGNIVVIAGFMFGTLGNIPDHQAALRQMKSLIQGGGEGILTVFNSDARVTGFSVYSTIKDLVGHELFFNNESNTFSTEKSFYSHWFTQDEFRKLLRQSSLYLLEPEKTIRLRGITARVATGIVGSKMMDLELADRLRALNSRSFSRLRASYELVCPNCAQVLCKLPITSSQRCSKCRIRYNVGRISGFTVPILFRR